MANILLLGAGFSANWGAPVTSGVFNALIADPEIRASEQIRNLLWRNRKNFEIPLGGLQHNFRHNTHQHREPLLLMQRALSRVFGNINTLFSRQSFELQDGQPIDRHKTVIEFLAKFDAIFSLNQDLLLELGYLDHAHNQLTTRRWNGSCLPGVTPAGNVGFGGPAFSGRTWSPNGDYTIQQNTQPFFKLHGSTNWKDTGANSDIMIMGGGKVEAIQAIPVLQRYQAFFTEYAHRGDTRVTIIGYGFGDDHINAILKAGIETRGLRMYVIDPRGSGLAHDMRPFGPNNIGPAVTEFEEWFERGLYSASSMPFRRLLRDESLDISVLNDYLAGR